MKTAEQEGLPYILQGAGKNEESEPQESEEEELAKLMDMQKFMLSGQSAERQSSESQQPEVQATTDDTQTISDAANKRASSNEIFGIDFSRPLGTQLTESFLDSPMAQQAAGGMIGGFVGGAGNAPGVLLGSALGSEAMRKLADGINAFRGKGDEKPMDEQLLEVAENVVLDRTVGPILGVAAGKIPNPFDVLRTRRLKRADGTPEEIARAFKEIGATPTPGALGSGVMQGIEGALAVTPISSSKIGSMIDTAFDGLEASWKKSMNKKGKVSTMEDAGKGLIVALKGEKGSDAPNWLSGQRKIQNELYAKRDGMLPKGINTEATETLAVLDDIYSVRKNTGMDPELAKLRDQLRKEVSSGGKPLRNKAGFTAERPSAPKKVIEKRSGELPFNEFSAKKTDIREMQKGRIATTASEGDLKRLHAAMKLDETNTILSAGGDDAMKATIKAHDFTTNLADKINMLEKVADSKLFHAAMNAAKSGSKQSAQLMRELKSAVNGVAPKSWNDFVSTSIHEMGRVSDAEKSASDAAEYNIKNFIKNYNAYKRSGVADVMFGKKTNLRKSLDNLNKASLAMKDSVGMRDISKTAPMAMMNHILNWKFIAGGGALASATGAPAVATGAALSLGPPAIMAALSSSPSFNNWMAKGIRVAQKPNNTKAFKDHLIRLANVGEDGPEAGKAAIALMSNLQNSVLAEESEQKNIGNEYF